ncbi:hypothetical protein MRX96_012601 [Rhipicephalus microplus]
MIGPLYLGGLAQVKRGIESEPDVTTAVGTLGLSEVRTGRGPLEFGVAMRLGRLPIQTRSALNDDAFAYAHCDRRDSELFEVS